MKVYKHKSWFEVALDEAKVDFKTIGSRTVVLKPELPAGYLIANHENWILIRDEILQDWATASFTDLDLKASDLKLLEKTTGCEFGDSFIPYLLRKDWLSWTCSFDTAWANLEQSISELTDRFAKDFENEDGLLRVMPPDAKIALEQIARYASADVTPST